jgi:hypothetical protein
MKLSNMVMVGAAHKNVGKTEFCCDLIRKYARHEQVIGIKVTPEDGPVDGDNWQIYEETGEETGKDTTRMLEAGASSVYWVCVQQDFLEEAMEDLLEDLPDGACLVCESTRVRHVIEPGVFVIIRKMAQEGMKPSCEALIDQADQVVVFEANSWDVTPESVSFVDGSWQLD